MVVVVITWEENGTELGKKKNYEKITERGK